MELHTYIKCTKCGYAVRSSRHTPEECEGFRKFGKYEDNKGFKIKLWYTQKSNSWECGWENW